LALVDRERQRRIGPRRQPKGDAPPIRYLPLREGPETIKALERHFGNVAVGTRTLTPRRLLTRQAKEKIARPGIGNDHARKDHQNKRDRSPGAEHVVPVEVAGLAWQAAPEPQYIAELAPSPDPRHPKIRAGQHEEQEGEIARSGDGSRGVPLLVFCTKPAMPIGDLPKKGADRLRSFTQNLAGVRIDVDGAAPSEAHRRGRFRIGLERY
jgi:hypothetical protein